MQYTMHYDSPLGGILIACVDEGLTGLWFDGQKYFPEHIDREHEKKDHPVFEETVKWLDIYFSGKAPDFTPKLHLTGTEFQMSVWDKLLKIPYGRIVTYGELSRLIAAERGASGMSAQAVGGAVGHNKISIIVPCHRVIGADGSLTGYAGGIGKKKALLELEKPK